MQKSNSTTAAAPPPPTPEYIIEQLHDACDDIDKLKNILVEMYCEINIKSYDPRYTNTFEVLYFHLTKIQSLKQ